MDTHLKYALLPLLFLGCNLTETPVSQWQPIRSLAAAPYQDYSLNALQKRINWYPQSTPSGKILCSFQGFQAKGAVANNAACRGWLYSNKDLTADYLVSVHGNTVYNIGPAGQQTAPWGAYTGTLSTSSGPVYMVEGTGNQILLVDGTNGYVLDPSSKTVTTIVDANFPTSPKYCAWLASRFIVSKGSTGTFYVSELNDAADWTPSVFATAESGPDAIMQLVTLGNQLYVMGANTIEPWYPIGSTSTPFAPITGASISVGITEPAAVTKLGDKIVFVGVNATQRGAVFVLERGGGLTKISTPYIEDKISDWNLAIDDSYAFGYTNQGHEFYELYNLIVSTENAWVYDFTEKEWFETTRTDRVLRGAVNAFPNNTVPPLAFSRSNGSIYWLGTNATPYNQFASGNAITRTLDFTIDPGISRGFNRGMRLEFEADHDSSTSYTFSGTLSWSDDAGATFTTPITLSKAVTSGTTAQKVILQTPPLGSFRAGRVYRLVFAGPAARIILRGGDMLFEKGAF